MSTLNKQLVTEWIHALRSGEYKQTRGVLRDKTGYCCLGVLADVAIKIGAIKGSWEEEENVCKKCEWTHPRKQMVFVDGDTQECKKLPNQILPLLGDRINNVGVWHLDDDPTSAYHHSMIFEMNGDFHCNSLTSANDAGVSFKSIADVIEQIFPEAASE